MLAIVYILFTRDITFVDTSTYIQDMELQKSNSCKKVWLFSKTYRRVCIYIIVICISLYTYIKVLMAVYSLTINSSTMSRA
jgi:hypothetical protein